MHPFKQFVSSCLLKAGRKLSQAARTIDPPPEPLNAPNLHKTPDNYHAALGTLIPKNAIMARDYRWLLEVKGVLDPVDVHWVDGFGFDYQSEDSTKFLSFSVYSYVQAAHEDKAKKDTVANVLKWAESKEKRNAVLSFYSGIGDKLYELTFKGIQVAVVTFPKLSYDSSKIVEIEVGAIVTDGCSFNSCYGE